MSRVLVTIVLWCACAPHAPEVSDSGPATGGALAGGASGGETQLGGGVAGGSPTNGGMAGGESSGRGYSGGIDAGTPDAGTGSDGGSAFAWDRCQPREAPPLPMPLRTLFVDGDHGSDLNSGTNTATAWKTLDKASMAALPGDLVWVSGSFDGGFLRPNSGTPQNPIVFRVPLGRRAVLSNSRLGAALVVGGRSHLVFDGFELTGNGQPVDFLNSDHIWVRNTRIVRSGYARVINSNDNRFEGNDWPECSTYCLYFSNGANRNVVTRNRFGRATSVQVHFVGTVAEPNRDNELSFNRFENPLSYQVSLLGVSTRTSVVCNEFLGAGSAMTDGGLPGPALTVANSENLIESNIFVGNRGEAIRIQSIGQNVTGNRVVHNTLVSNGGPAVRLLWSLTSAVIDENHIVNNLMWANNVSNDFHWTANGQPFEVVADFYHKGVNGYADGGIGENLIHHNVIGTGDADIDGGWFYLIGSTQARKLSMTQAQATWPTTVFSNLEVNPRLVDLDAGLLMLASGSPAIDRGAALDGGLTFGTAPDPGRFEWHPQ